MPALMQITIDDINSLQTAIMLFVDVWVKTKKTAIPQKEIIEHMVHEGVKTYTTVNALHSLIKKGYIKKGFNIEKRTETIYIQLRRV